MADHTAYWEYNGYSYSATATSQSMVAPSLDTAYLKGLFDFLKDEGTLQSKLTEFMDDIEAACAIDAFDIDGTTNIGVLYDQLKPDVDALKTSVSSLYESITSAIDLLDEEVQSNFGAWFGYYVKVDQNKITDEE